MKKQKNPLLRVLVFICCILSASLAFCLTRKRASRSLNSLRLAQFLRFLLAIAYRQDNVEPSPEFWDRFPEIIRDLIDRKDRDRNDQDRDRK